MSVNEDYAGGSYKSNGELENDIDDLRSLISRLEDRIIELESSVSRLESS